MPKSISLLIADDHQMFLDGISVLLADRYIIVGLCANKFEVITHLEMNIPNVLLLDIDFGKTDGIEFCKELTEKYKNLNVLALTMHSEGIYVNMMIDAGAKGYLLKEASKEELCFAIDQIASGNTYFSTKASVNMVQSIAKKKGKVDEVKLSKREKEVLQMILKEHTTSEIADKLFVSKHTIETHRGNLIAKMGVRNVAGLVKKTIELGLLK